MYCNFLHIQPERGSAVPKFGEWDEKDPSTGEAFTGIFDKVREEKQSGSGNASVVNSDAGYNRSNQNHKYGSSVSSLQTCCYAADFDFFCNEMVRFSLCICFRYLRILLHFDFLVKLKLHV
jgi:hypothetical protein